MSVAVSGFSAEPTNSIPRPRYAQPNGPVHSPEILADQHITFRLAAPRATEVTVMGQWTNAPVPMEMDLQQYEKALELFEQGGSLPGSAKATGKRNVRVLLTGVPTAHGAGSERIIHLIENAGATIVCSENCTGLKPILEDVNVGIRDPLKAIATKYYHLPCSVMVRALETALKTKVIVASIPQYTGALGAALMAGQKASTGLVQ